MYIKLKNVQKQYQDKIILQDVTLTIDKPGIYYLKGKSGSGKTTLFNIIAGFENFEKGSREVGSNCFIASIFQSFELIDELTVRENIELVKDVFDLKDTKMIETLGLTPLLEHYPSELSGGQRQRVSILRALLIHPQIILCDEPTVSLDYENRKIVLDLLEGLAKECAVIISSHNEQELVNYVDFMYEIKNNQVFLVKENHNLQSLSVPDYELNLNKLKKYLCKMVPLQKRIFILFCSTITLLGLILIQADRQIFHPPINDHIRNSDVLYVTRYNQNIKSKTPLITFEPVVINEQSYLTNIYPYVENKDFKNVKLENNEIQINQYLKELLPYQSPINKSITLQYRLDGEIYEETFVIKSVINEELQDKRPQIYYNYDYLMNLLKAKYHSYKYKTQYDYFINNYTLFQLQSTDVAKEYLNYSKNDQVTVYSSVYTPYYQEMDSMEIYHMIYVIGEVLIMIIGIIFIVYQENKYLNLMKYRLSILASLSLPFNKLKYLYMFQFFKKSLCLLLMALLEIMIYFFIVETSYVSILLSFIYAIIILFVILGYLLVKMMQYHYRDIAAIFKDNKN